MINFSIEVIDFNGIKLNVNIFYRVYLDRCMLHQILHPYTDKDWGFCKYQIHMGFDNWVWYTYGLPGAWSNQDNKLDHLDTYLG